MTKILFLGDSAATGFGTVTADLGTELLNLGHDLRFWSMNEDGTEPQYEPFVGRTAMSGNPDGWLAANQDPKMRERLEGMFLGRLFMDGWVPDAGIILGDVGSLKMSPVLSFVPPDFPVFHYVPIEGVGLPPRWAAVWNILKPVAMSQFGATQIATIMGGKVPPVVYHGVSDDFRPVAQDDAIVFPARRAGQPMSVLRTKQDCKRFLGLDPDRIVLLRTDRFMPRKNYASLLRAVAPVLASHPDTDLLMHCLPMDQGGDLVDEISKYGSLGSRMLLSNFAGRADRKVMRTLYNAADIYVSVSAEGFGLTIAEALACGLPAVAMDYSSVPEVVGPAGVVVPIGGLIDNIYAHYWAIVDEPKFGEELTKLVEDRFLRRRLGSYGPPHIRDNFRWPLAAAQFGALLDPASVPEQEAVAV